MVQNPQIAATKSTAKIIRRTLATILFFFILWIVVPSFWFWVIFEVLALLLVVIGCAGEWYLHIHPSGRKKAEKDEHHKIESRFIAAVALGVFMELFSLGHTIREGVKLEAIVTEATKQAAEANRLAGIANKEASEAKLETSITESNNLILRSNVVALELKWEPRTITAEQTNFIKKTLEGWPRAPIAIVAVMDNAEAQAFAAKIADFLTGLGFPVSRQGAFGGAEATTGILVAVKDLKNPPRHGVLLTAAFSASGINTHSFEMTTLASNAVQIRVHPKN